MKPRALHDGCFRAGVMSTVRAAMTDPAMTDPGMTDPAEPSAKRVLETTERIAESLFGLIMVLTFTGSSSIAEAGRDDVRAMRIGALGCNIAWGIIDAVLNLMQCLVSRSRSEALIRAVRTAGDAEQVRAAIDAELPRLWVLLEPSALLAIQQRLRLRARPSCCRWVSVPDRRSSIRRQ